MLLIDADALSKLAHWNLLAEVVHATNAEWSQSATFGSLLHRSRRSIEKPDGKLFRSAEAAGRAVSALKMMLPLPEVNASELSWVQGVSAIDPGEALLIAVARREASARILTGDKRALRALANLERSVWMPVAGKVILVEQVLLSCLNRHGIEWLRERVCPAFDFDKTVEIVMGSRCDTPTEAVRDGLTSYIREIRDIVAPSLICSL